MKKPTLDPVWIHDGELFVPVRLELSTVTNQMLPHFPQAYLIMDETGDGERLNLFLVARKYNDLGADISFRMPSFHKIVGALDDRELKNQIETVDLGNALDIARKGKIRSVTAAFWLIVWTKLRPAIRVVCMSRGEKLRFRIFLGKKRVAKSVDAAKLQDALYGKKGARHRIAHS